MTTDAMIIGLPVIDLVATAFGLFVGSASSALVAAYERNRRRRRHMKSRLERWGEVALDGPAQARRQATQQRDAAIALSRIEASRVRAQLLTAVPYTALAISMVILLRVATSSSVLPFSLGLLAAAVLAGTLYVLGRRRVLTVDVTPQLLTFLPEEPLTRSHAHLEEQVVNYLIRQGWVVEAAWPFDLVARRSDRTVLIEISAKLHLGAQYLRSLHRLAAEHGGDQDEYWLLVPRGAVKGIDVDVLRQAGQFRVFEFSDEGGEEHLTPLTALSLFSDAQRT